MAYLFNMEPWLIILGFISAIYLFIITPHQKKTMKQKKEKKEELVDEARKKLKPILEKGFESYMGKHAFDAPIQELEKLYRDYHISYEPPSFDWNTEFEGGYDVTHPSDNEVLKLLELRSTSELNEIIEKLSI